MTDAHPADARTVVTRNDDRRRYDLHVDDVLAGFAHFRRDARDRLVFDHTEIDDAFAGRGLGKVLASEALADVASRDEVVVPECPFIVKYLHRTEVTGLRVEWPDDEGADPASSPAAT